MTQSQVLLRCFQLITQSGVCPKTRPFEWVKNLLYLHGRNMLYIGFEKGEIVCTAAMYRIPTFNEKSADEYPLSESGRILYIPFFVSVAKDKMLPKRLLNRYLQQNPDIEEIIFYERNSDKNLKRFKRIKKEVVDEQTKSTKSAECPGVSGKPDIPGGGGRPTGTGATANVV